MSTRTAKQSQGSGASPVVIAIAVVVLVVFIAWRGWVALRGPVAGPLPPPPTADINFVKQKSIEVQGNFDKLSPEDQDKVQKITHGWGKSAIISNWGKHQRGEQ